ncbi:HAMP domain-containing protein [Synechococcales cyanobacterium C]|uniref:HAMP domain-containing protein n=1 Tax=Petrachloros mirabilis ULC683 TaxID=2781853 RepID=A0A8K2A7U8_9CYAN|nr:HAMP domain-containing methyl-accepting chemotaxis protein [Petrachloros mirabilis]NCJ06460.1 HAMP domain-containing protein [Petrachloros mirabilis ULC683]
MTLFKDEHMPSDHAEQTPTEWVTLEPAQATVTELAQAGEDHSPDALTQVTPSLTGQQFKGLRAKVTVAAIALSTIPLAITGGITWSAVQSAIPAPETAPETAAVQQPGAATTNRLLLILMANLVVTAAAVGWIAWLLSERATQPLTKATQAIQAIRQGDLDTRLSVTPEDELGHLATQINEMAEHLQNQAQEQALALQKEREVHAEVMAQQAAAAERDHQQNLALQQELLQLLSEVEGATSGNLMVRAEIGEGQIGIVADFFNSIIESMRDIVTQVKAVTVEVNSALGQDEAAIGDLAKESSKQAKKIQRMLTFVEQMAQSIAAVASNAHEAAEVARNASSTAETGGEAMDRVVQSIVQLRETVAETAKKVKQLGESSQQISKAVSLINQIALQTNLLAINASIEAARAGEEGRGFAVVAEEVGALAAQSATATKEIEKIVELIQRSTSEVVDAMERGTTQVVEGSGRVEEAKHSLEQIISVSHDIDQLVQSISTATVSQAKTSDLVKALMQDIVKTSEESSKFSNRVVTSIHETAGLAQQLKTSVDVFKVSEAVEV